MVETTMKMVWRTPQYFVKWAIAQKMRKRITISGEGLTSQECVKVGLASMMASSTATVLNALVSGYVSVTTGKHIVMSVESTISPGCRAFPVPARVGAVVVALGTLMMTTKSLNVFYVKV
jgi:hypothetical protein